MPGMPGVPGMPPQADPLYGYFSAVAGAVRRFYFCINSDIYQYIE